MVAPTPSRSNLAAHAALSPTRPMVVSAITHSTGEPSPFFRFLLINSATAFATGYFPTDVNGDGTVDALDLILIDNNAAMSLSVAHP